MSEPSISGQPKKNSRIRVIFFALVLSVICSLLITISAVGLKDRQMANMELDRKVNLLKAAGLIADKKPDRKKIIELYDDHIKDVVVDHQGKILEDPTNGALHLYFILDHSAVKGYIIPIDTRGLWGMIKGYLAFENDGKTVSGFSVFSHSETPGLGGEIESNWFRKNFKGKKILNSQNKFVSITIAKGKVENLPENQQDYYVDGISGATLTGKYLSQGMKRILKKYDVVSVRFRQHNIKASDIHQ